MTVGMLMCGVACSMMCVMWLCWCEGDERWCCMVWLTCLVVLHCVALYSDMAIVCSANGGVW